MVNILVYETAEKADAELEHFLWHNMNVYIALQNGEKKLGEEKIYFVAQLGGYTDGSDYFFAAAEPFSIQENCDNLESLVQEVKQTLTTHTFKNVEPIFYTVKHNYGHNHTKRGDTKTDLGSTAGQLVTRLFSILDFTDQIIAESKQRNLTENEREEFIRLYQL